MYRRLFMGLLVLALCAVAFGFYRGWFVLGSGSSEPGTNKVDYKLTVDQDKVKADVAAAEKKASDLTGKSTEGTK